MSDYQDLCELFKSWSGSAVLAVSQSDCRWLRHHLGLCHIWELRKRGKRSHKNRRKGSR